MPFLHSLFLTVLVVCALSAAVWLGWTFSGLPLLDGNSSSIGLPLSDSRLAQFCVGIVAAIGIVPIFMAVVAAGGAGASAPPPAGAAATAAAGITLAAPHGVSDPTSGAAAVGCRNWGGGIGGIGAEWPAKGGAARLAAAD